MGNWKFEIGNGKWEIGKGELERGNWKFEIGNWEVEKGKLERVNWKGELERGIWKWEMGKGGVRRSALSGEECAQQLRVCVLGPLWEAEGARGSGCAVVSRVVIALASLGMRARAHHRVRWEFDERATLTGPAQ